MYGRKRPQAVAPDLDETTALRAARQDLRLFEPLYERYVDRIHTYCRHRVGPQDAEDVTSQVFIQALAGLASYRGGSVAAWLFRIARHCVVDHLRYRRPQVSLDEFELPLIDERPDPAEHVTHQEDLRMARRLLHGLSDADRDLVALKLVSGLNASEIASVLGKSAVAVRVDWHRVVKRLRAEFNELERTGGRHG